jgi:type IV secretory pathway TraG/TraD family ATPase VirD4
MQKTLGMLRDLLIAVDGPPVDAMAGLGGKALSAAAMLSQGSEEVVGSIMSTCLSNTKWLDSAAMRKGMSESDFSLLDLNNGHTTIYVVLPPQYLSVHARSLRLFMNQTLVAALNGRKGKHPTLLICDEAHAIGPLAMMEKCAALGRGFGLRVMWFLQSLSQLIDMYPGNWPTFFACSGQVQMFSISDKDGAQFLSQMIGYRQLWKKKMSADGSGSRTWEKDGAFWLRDPTEVSRLVSREGGLQVVLREGADPFLLRRTPYDKTFPASQYAPDPFEPRPQSLANRMFQKLREVMT